MAGAQKKFCSEREGKAPDPSVEGTVEMRAFTGAEAHAAGAFDRQARDFAGADEA
jgi:hypothetical protein